MNEELEGLRGVAEGLTPQDVPSCKRQHWRMPGDEMA